MIQRCRNIGKISCANPVAEKGVSPSTQTGCCSSSSQLKTDLTRAMSFTPVHREALRVMNGLATACLSMILVLPKTSEFQRITSTMILRQTLTSFSCHHHFKKVPTLSRQNLPHSALSVPLGKSLRRSLTTQISHVSLTLSHLKYLTLKILLVWQFGKNSLRSEVQFPFPRSIHLHERNCALVQLGKKIQLTHGKNRYRFLL